MFFLSMGIGALFAWIVAMICGNRKCDEDTTMPAVIITFLIFAGGSYVLFEHFIL